MVVVEGCDALPLHGIHIKPFWCVGLEECLVHWLAWSQVAASIWIPQTRETDSMQGCQHLHLATGRFGTTIGGDSSFHNQGDLKKQFIRTWKDRLIFREISAEQGRVGSSAIAHVVLVNLLQSYSTGCKRPYTILNEYKWRHGTRVCSSGGCSKPCDIAAVRRGWWVVQI